MPCVDLAFLLMGANVPLLVAPDLRVARGLKHMTSAASGAPTHVLRDLSIV